MQEESGLQVAEIQGLLFLLPALKKLYREAELAGPLQMVLYEDEVDKLAEAEAETIRRTGGNRLWWLGALSNDPDQSRCYFITGNGPKSEARARLLRIVLEVVPDLFTLLDWILEGALEEAGLDYKQAIAEMTAKIEAASSEQMEWLASALGTEG